MSEKLNSLRRVCDKIEMVAALTFALTCAWAGMGNSIARLIATVAAVIDLIAYSIEFGAQVVINGEKPDKIIAICGIVIMLFYIKCCIM